jgi:hypothetical protein
MENMVALDLLTQIWGSAYDTGCDAGTWWYRRKDGKGGTHTASSPGELHQMIADDHAFMPARTAS